MNKSGQYQRTFEAEPQVQVFVATNEVKNLTIQDFGQVTTSSEQDMNNVKDDVAETEWERSEKFHFAMAARWHDGIAANEPLEVEKLPKWIAGCIRYTTGQLRYIYKTKHNSA